LFLPRFDRSRPAVLLGQEVVGCPLMIGIIADLDAAGDEKMRLQIG